MNNADAITRTIVAGLAKRHAAEKRFRAYGIASLSFAALMLLLLLASIVGPGLGGFTHHQLRLDVATAPYRATLTENPQAADFHAMANAALRAGVAEDFSDPTKRHELYALAGTFAAFDVKRAVLAHPAQWGGTLPVWISLGDNADMLLKGRIDPAAPASQRALNDRQIGWVDHWRDEGRIRHTLNTDFLTHGDSRAPEAAGFGGSVVGSLLMLLICFAVALPIALMAAITLEEFARKTRFAEWLEIAINNLAAVPSIIYGLLGLSVFLHGLGLARSSPLAGGLTLAMLIMPVLIISARAAIRAVPPSMRQAATALGASPLQVVRHHVLPYALPGILTGTILSLCRALGETAPLLMIGMVAFVADVPHGFGDPATAMPVQIFLWSSSPELGFVEKTSAGIMLLLAILLLLNAGAISLRNRRQLTWN